MEIPVTLMNINKYVFVTVGQWGHTASGCFSSWHSFPEGGQSVGYQPQTPPSSQELQVNMQPTCTNTVETIHTVMCLIIITVMIYNNCSYSQCYGIVCVLYHQSNVVSFSPCFLYRRLTQVCMNVVLQSCCQLRSRVRTEWSWSWRVRTCCCSHPELLRSLQWSSSSSGRSSRYFIDLLSSSFISFLSF